jgi:hypothetical protein
MNENGVYSVIVLLAIAQHWQTTIRFLLVDNSAIGVPSQLYALFDDFILIRYQNDNEDAPALSRNRKYFVYGCARLVMKKAAGIPYQKSLLI